MIEEPKANTDSCNHKIYGSPDTTYKVDPYQEKIHNTKRSQMKIDILGVTHTIDFVNTSINKNIMGRWEEKEAKILIANDLPKDVAQQTIWHEVTHCVLSYIGEAELSNNEDFVNKLSTALNQVALLKLKNSYSEEVTL